MKKLITMLALCVLLVFIVFIVNQTNQFVDFATKLHPKGGVVAFWLLMTVYALGLLIPVYLLFRFPKALIPPENQNSSEYHTFILALKERLRHNKNVPNEMVNDFEVCLEHLKGKSDVIIRSAGRRAFVSTAISQYGALDSLFVLVISTRLVWEIAYVYNQRPAIREVVWLYSNVAGTVFLTGQLEDAEVMESLSAGVFELLPFSALGAIPGAQIISNSLMNGVFNSWLVLRIGIITQKYCSTTVKLEKRSVKRAAMILATGALGSIVKEDFESIVKAIAKKFGGDLFDRVKDMFRKRKEV